jgi:hypothetical protein
MLGQAVWRSIAQTSRRVSQADPLAASLGCVLLGALFGGLSGLTLPHRIVPAHRMPGISVLVAPLVTGTLMHLYSRWRRRSRRDPPWLATFSGGYLFAFVFAIVRVAMVR